MQSHVLLCPGLFNLRGSDIEYNPLFFAYAIVTLSDVRYTHTSPQPRTHTPHHIHPSQMAQCTSPQTVHG